LKKSDFWLSTGERQKNRQVIALVGDFIIGPYFCLTTSKEILFLQEIGFIAWLKKSYFLEKSDFSSGFLTWLEKSDFSSGSLTLR
jgi:hypothetical protein